MSESLLFTDSIVDVWLSGPICGNCVGIDWVCCVVRVDMRRSPLVVISVECGRVKFFSCISCNLVLSANRTGFWFSVVGGKVVRSF